MKKFCLSLALLILSLNIIAQKRKIINPFYEATTSGIYHIDKIELNNKDTRVYICCTFVPYWWVKFSKADYLQDADTGEKYFATAMIGGEFDKEIHMPASGDSSFVLIYPKLKKTVKRLNFVEDDKEVIFGLSLDPEKHHEQTSAAIPGTVKSWVDTELARAKNKKLVNYASKEFFSRDTARLIGYINGYDPRVGFKTGIIYSENEITNEDFPTTVTIHEDGRFEAAIPMNHPQYTSVLFQHSWVKFYIEPGQTLFMQLSWDDFLMADRLRNIRYSFKEMEFDGPAARINKELSTVSVKTFDYEVLRKIDSTVTPEQFKGKTMNAWKQSQDQLELDLKDKNFTDQTRTILSNEINLSFASGIFTYVDPFFNNSATTTSQLSSGYYDFLKKVNLNDQSILIVSEFSTFINLFEFSEPFFTAQLTAYTAQLTNLEIPAGVPFENNLLNELELKPTTASMELQEWASKDSVLINYFKLEPNITYEIIKVRSLNFLFDDTFKNQKDEARSFLTALEKGITNPFLIHESEQLFRKAYPAVPKTAYDLPAGKGTDIFKKIIDQYKGKLVFVDFWATTCGPCVGAIKENKEIRETYKDSKELEFIFITAEDQSPLTRYNEFVKEQELVHTYRLSADDFNYLRELFRFNGIPHYAVINKEGQVLDDDYNMHDFESELQNLLMPGK
jgi:thiol-disulfide isomerase/thioredoxin